MIHTKQKVMTYKYLILVLFCFISFASFSQGINEAAARAEIQKRGYDADRFKEEMLKKGVNPESIDPNNPVEVARAKKAAEEVMVILDKEKKQNAKGKETEDNKEIQKPQSKIDETRTVDENVKVGNQTKDIQKAVKEGATIEEAVAEKIQETAKEKLPEATTYGQHIFRDKSLKLFRTAEDAKPSSSYVLGPGDKIAISIWGSSQENFSLEIEKDGYIQPTGLPRYYIAGLTIAQAKDLLSSRLRNYYFFQKENFELAVTTSRTINVNIVGEVFNSGTFNVSAINTAFNALIAAGGPNDIGSVRRIQVLSPGKKPKTLDVYQYLQNPIITQNFYLSENDYINVPVAQKLVTVTGSVNRPFRYELLENENLVELIKYSGGLKANALKGNVQVKRIEYDSIRIIDINYADIERTGRNFTLMSGDSIRVFEIFENVKNEVTISGAVENPGNYAMTNKDRISDLILKAKLLNNAITSIAYLKRFNDDFKTVRYEYINLDNILSNAESIDNIILQKGDELIVSSKATFSDSYTMKIEGAVRFPTEMVLDVGQNLKISDAIFFAGGLKDDATDFAYIFRTKLDAIKTQEYIEINLKEALENPDSPFNITVEPKDKLIVYSKNTYIDETYIKIAGAVRSPGDFVYNPTLKLKDVILLAGGLKREASLERIDIYRLEFRQEKSTRVLVAKLSLDENYNIKKGGSDFDLEPFDQIFVRNAPQFELQRNVFISGEVLYPGTYALMGDNTKLSTIITEAGGVTNEAFLKGATLQRYDKEIGFVIIDIDKALKNPKSHENIILQEGDELFIPKTSNVVSISGATRAFELYRENIIKQNKIQVPYQIGKTAKYYVDEYAGGFSKDAALSKVTVIDASGKVTKAKGFLFFKRYPKVGPGAEIKVGFKDIKDDIAKGEKGEDVKWGEILANSIAQATAILSLILLIQNVN